MFFLGFVFYFLFVSCIFFLGMRWWQFTWVVDFIPGLLCIICCWSLFHFVRVDLWLSSIWSAWNNTEFYIIIFRLCIYWCTPQSLIVLSIQGMVIIQLFVIVAWWALFIFHIGKHFNDFIIFIQNFNACWWRCLKSSRWSAGVYREHIMIYMRRSEWSCCIYNRRRMRLPWRCDSIGWVSIPYIFIMGCK